MAVNALGIDFVVADTESEGFAQYPAGCPNGLRMFCSDTQKTYVQINGAWVTQADPMGGGSGTASKTFGFFTG